MTLKAVVGTVAVLAVVVVLGLHGCHNDAGKAKVIPAPAPTPIAITVPIKKIPVAAPTPAPKPKAVPRDYERVAPGGKFGGIVSCSFVRSFTAGKTPAELDALSKQYKVSAAQLAQYKQCFR